MKKSVAFTGNNYSLLCSIVSNRRHPGVRDTKNNVNNHVNSILKAHFDSAQVRISAMGIGEQIEVNEIDHDTIKAIRHSIRDKEFQSLNCGDGTFIVKRTK